MSNITIYHHFSQSLPEFSRFHMGFSINWGTPKLMVFKKQKDTSSSPPADQFQMFRYFSSPSSSPADRAKEQLSSFPRSNSARSFASDVFPEPGAPVTPSTRTPGASADAALPAMVTAGAGAGGLTPCLKRQGHVGFPTGMG